MKITDKIIFQSQNMLQIICHHDHSDKSPAPARRGEKGLTKLSLSPETLTDVRTPLILGYALVLGHGPDNREGKRDISGPGPSQRRPGQGGSVQEEEGGEWRRKRSHVLASLWCPGQGQASLEA